MTNEKLFQLAVEILGSEEKATRWLSRPNGALGGATPLAYASTEEGSMEVHNVLWRLEYGIPAT